VTTTEQKILEAARQVFLKKGWNGARMQEIADEAGINKALLHYYYRSKDKLFEAVFNEIFTQFITKVSLVLLSDAPVKEK
jgi:AcrR family transcriptional regulator